MTVSLFGLTIVRSSELQALRAAAAREAPAPATSPVSDPECEVGEGVVQEVIRLADGLLDLSHSVRDGDRQTVIVLRWTRARASSLLAACHIRAVEDNGHFDPVRHQAVASRPAPRPELADRIAETVRPGYMSGPHGHDVVLRPQQVVLYVAPTPDSESMD